VRALLNRSDIHMIRLTTSVLDGQSGDLISLDMLFDLSEESSYVEMAWLVDAGTAKLLEQCAHESSHDGVTWVTYHTLFCIYIMSLTVGLDGDTE